MSKTIDGNEVLRQLKKARSKTPQNSGSITQNGKILAAVQDSQPISGKEPQVQLTPKQQFLKQIENYNDFTIKNDLDAEQINPEHDYDFDAFTSPEDWQVESQRLKDHLSDRKIEIKQNEDAGEFAGMELENGVPSYEATQNMSDEEYAEYEKKYLLPSPNEFRKEPATLSKSAPSEVITPSSIEAKQPFKPSKPNFIKTSRDASPELIALRAKNKADNERPDNGGVAIPVDVGSRVGDTGALNLARDFVQDGLGSFFKGRDEMRDRRYLPRDLYVAEKKRLHKKSVNDKIEADKLAEVQKLRTREPKPSSQMKNTESKPIDWKNVATNTFPVSLVSDSVNNAQDAYRSLQKIREQSDKYGASTVAQDAGKGVMGGLADMTGSVLNVGGLVKNPAGNYAKESAQWWKNRQEIPNSESARLGEALGDSAVLGVVGGIAGRGLGSMYKSVRYSAEDARKRITRLANDRARMIHERQTKMDKPWTGTSSSGAKPNRPSLTENRQRVYENLTQLPEKKNILTDGIGVTVKRSAERAFGEKAMIQKNDDQLSQLFSKTGSLKKAKSHQKKNWESTPVQYQKIGAGLGGAVGLGL